MHRFLVVGCGGSGGATVRFMMDQLKADLATHGIGQIPKGWQFVHIDVPVAPDAGPGLLGSVPDMGGDYRALARPGATYGAFAATVDNQFRAAAALNALASWRPDPPRVTVPIQTGAGQYRAVGRTMTLAAAANQIKPALDVAWSRLQGADVNAEMQQIADQLPGAGEANAASPPIVLVISSMAGGSGASMVLDVARLLSMIDGVDPGLTAMFLFSPDAFESLDPSKRTGVEANAAAALAELLAMQAAADDEPGTQRKDDPFRALGMVGLDRPKSFGRVFPVGRRIGHGGAILGDGKVMTIYRAVGRGLAALMLAGQASREFVDYDLTNVGGVGALRDQFGWGASADNVSWGTFGFATLSLGRDRYAEYSAQRLARLAVDRLATGHQRAGDARTGAEQVNGLVESGLRGFQTLVGLPEPGSQATQWFDRVAFPGDEMSRAADDIARKHIDDFVQESQAGPQLGQWISAVESRVLQEGRAVRDGIDRSAQRWALSWHTKLADAVEAQAAAAIGAWGLPYAIALLNRSVHQIEQLASDLATASARHADPVRLPAEQGKKVEQLRQVRRGAVTNVAQIAKELRTGYRQSVTEELRYRSAAIAAEILNSLAADFYRPLINASGDALSDVERVRTAKVDAVGIAALRTDEYAAWPKDGEELVPDRFAHAENEVLLTTSAEFPTWYAAHLQAQDPSKRPEDVRAFCADAVTRGEWPDVAGVRPPGGLIERLADWRPATIALDPDTGQPIIPGVAKFFVHTRSGEILRRSRLFVDRPQQPFSAYTSESLYDFVAAAGITAAQQQDREDLVVRSFRQALDLARPIVGVSNEAITHVHGPGAGARQYKFSPIPLEGLAVANQMMAVLRDGAMNINLAAQDRFEGALTSSSRTARIDIFGSYANYLPIVFTSFLQPIAARWAATPDFGRSGFWLWRRARPIPEALPMSQAHRRAMVGGWLIGRVTGQLRVPDDVGLPGAAPVQVWDVRTGGWLAFPNPLLVPRTQMRGPADVLPAVLESMVLAIASCHESPHQQPLQPFTALRRLFDEGQQGPTTGMGDRPAAALQVATWLRDGKSRSGASIIDTTEVRTAELTSAERQQALLNWTRSTRQHYEQLRQQYSSVLDDNRLIAVDLSEDFVWALTRIEDYTRDPSMLAPVPTKPTPGWGGGPNT